MKFFSYIKNKYIIVLLAFVFYIAFIEDVDIFTLYKRKQKLRELKEEKQRKELSINKVRKNMEIFDDPDELERFAREQYFFKKESEDIFVIVEE